MLTHQPRKRFGQNFLHDQNILNKMAQSIQVKPGDSLVEIGPGQGALTQHLLATAQKLEAIEIDRDLIQLLKEKFSQHPNFTLYNADILSFDFSTLQQPSPLRVVGNLPYNISTPLLFKLYALGERIQDMYFLLQKEVVDRMCAKVNDHNYGRLSIMSQYFCECHTLFGVSPQCFTPAPKVDSAFIQLIPRQPALIAQTFAQFELVVRTAFTFRRKTLSNSLKSLLTSAQLEKIGIDPSLRPQNLSVTDYVRISNSITLE